MKRTLLFSLLSTITFGTIYGQESHVRYNKTDTVPQVKYTVLDERGHATIEIQGQDYFNEIVASLKDEGIKSVETSKEKKKLIIELKPDYKPVLISLSELKNKYTNIKSKRVLFRIEDRFVQQNPDHVLVDASNIMLISISPVKFIDDLEDLFMMTLIPRTDKNIKKFNEIRLR